jgi:flagellum-specific ATP synthase
MSEHPFLARIAQVDTIVRTGQVRRILPTYVEADGPAVAVGSLCTIGEQADDALPSLARVVAVEERSIVLVPFEDASGIAFGASVVACPHANAVAVGDAFLGRAVDALARPIDRGPPIRPDAYAPLNPPLASPLLRTSSKEVLETGIRAIDALLTLGKGQRVGLFAASGVGKTSLLTQLARQVDADRCVICLVGERGREVEALWSQGLTDEAKARSVLVAATSDEAAAMRARACDYALALATHWRSQGHDVLLLLDSVTRLAMALREIGLAAGEPPTVRAYTPSVFSTVPKLVERCGAIKKGGSISAVMTVLSETDEVDDPISEMMKSLLDGHIILSRSLAEHGHFPAIDVPRSISRLAAALTASDHRDLAAKANRLLSTYDSSKLMIEAGVYVPGSSPEIDDALAARPALLSFLRQDWSERIGFDPGREALAAALRAGN